MPLPNNKDIQWNGYLVDDLAGAGERFVAGLERLLERRDLPSVRAQRAAVNMWWRRGSLCLDVQSNLDGSVICTVHAMDYGTALFVGIAFNTGFLTDNYYKRMAATCFLESLDRCVHQAVEETATEMQRGVGPVIQIGRSGKYGG